MDDALETGPLAAAMLHTLLALSGEDLHGYAIMQAVLEQTNGDYKLGPGTLYDTLQRLLERGWVTELPGESKRRRVYRLSAGGRAVLKRELDRLEAAVRLGKLNLRGA